MLFGIYMTRGFSNLTFPLFPLVKPISRCPPARTKKSRSNNPNHLFSQGRCEMPSLLCSVLLGGGTARLCTQAQQGARLEGAGAKRQPWWKQSCVGAQGNYQRLEPTSLPLPKPLLRAHPTQWERCLLRAPAPAPLFLPARKRRPPSDLAASRF